MPKFTWMHISDLHIGAPAYDWLWPNFKHKFLKDVDERLREIGPCHAVIFTGDMVHSGSKEQYSSANKELLELWEVFEHHGNRPVIICVPGNHDLVRPDDLDPVARLLQSFNEDEKLRNAYWTDANSTYVNGTRSHFSNFTEWYEKLDLPKPSKIRQGYLPGDFSCVIEIPGLKVGCIGINTAFLHLRDRIREKSLAIHQRQLIDACNGDPTDWCRNNPVNILATHHGIDWLTASSSKIYDSEIAPPGRFLIHLYGHMHSPTSKTLSEAGSPVRRFWQAPSMFGLEKCRNGELRRIHGYSFGQLVFSASQSNLCLVPRILRETYSGDHYIVPDTGYRLTTPTSFIESIERPIDTKKDIPGHSSKEQIDQLEVQTELIEDGPSESVARDKLSKVPRSKALLPLELRRVRQEEQSSMEAILRRERCIWVVADWGLGSDGFILAVANRLELQAEPFERFEISCEEVKDRDSFLASAQGQLGITFQEFCSHMSRLPASLLLFRDVPSSIADNTSQWLDGLLRSVLDYCPKAFLVLTTRSIPTSSTFSKLPLVQMSVPDVLNYIADHPDGGSEIATLDTAELLHRRSGGLPMHLGKLLHELKYGSLQDLVNDELDFSEEHLGIASEPVPKALVKTVASLSESKEKYSPRSFRLLKVLTVLSSGATLNSVKHFYSTEPFWSCNPEELEKMGLLTIIPLTTAASKIGLMLDDSGDDGAALFQASGGASAGSRLCKDSY